MLEIKISKNDSPQTYVQNIQRIPHHQLSYNDFFNNFMRPNIPVIITEISEDWECQKNWITSNNINFEYLKSKISNLKVPVANCKNQYSNSHEKCEMNFYDFLNYLNDDKKNINQDDSIYYLKDWHLRKQLPDYEFYQTPIYFGSDWLNEYLTKNEDDDDYKFVYIGPKGTWTPFHADVYSSYSWSTNIFGRKKWLILWPNEENKLLDKFHNYPFSINETMLMENNILYYVVVQDPGECIFVPSSWYHQVENLDDTISINHNWFNGCNIMEIWKKLWEYYGKVCKEIDDCRDMENFHQHCQVMLKATHGMNFVDFLNLLKKITKNRIKCLKTNEIAVINGFNYGPEHCRFDLNAITKVLCQIKDDTSSHCDDTIISSVHEKCFQLEEIINKFL